jgi:hypothetical protein
VQKPTWATWPAHPAEKCGTYASEPARIAADLKRNADKTSGALRAREDQRDLNKQIAQQCEVWL